MVLVAVSVALAIGRVLLPWFCTFSATPLHEEARYNASLAHFELTSCYCPFEPSRHRANLPSGVLPALCPIVHCS